MPYIYIQNDFHTDVSRGKVSKFQTKEKFGRVNDVDTGESVDISEGLDDAMYTGFPITVQSIEVFSSSTNDKPGGTGIYTLELGNLLDSSLDICPNTILTLDGTTVVTVSADYLRCSRGKGITGATPEAVSIGNITVRQAVQTGNVFLQIQAGKNQSNVMAYTVPNGKTFLIERLIANMTRTNGLAGSAQVALLNRPQGGIWNINKNPELSNSLGYDYISNTIVITEKYDIKGHVYSVSDNNTQVYMEISGKLVDD